MTKLSGALRKNNFSNRREVCLSNKLLRKKPIPTANGNGGGLVKMR